MPFWLSFPVLHQSHHRWLVSPFQSLVLFGSQEVVEKQNHPIWYVSHLCWIWVDILLLVFVFYHYQNLYRVYEPRDHLEVALPLYLAVL